METLEEKYIELLLKSCLSFKQSKSLLINLDLKEHLPFARKLKVRAMAMGILDVRIMVLDHDDTHEYLMNTAADDITNNPIIDRSPWSEYANKGGSLLLLMSTVPALMSDIEPEKMKRWVHERSINNRYYMDHVSLNTFPWTIAVLPNQRWADQVFPGNPGSYELLYLKIMEACMITEDNPLKSWQSFIEASNYYKDTLNALKISELHYRNGLGTDLKIGRNPEHLWLNLDKKDGSGNSIIVNMPSYEIFSAPHRDTAEGIVYGSRPFNYNGQLIEDFYIEFEHGRAIRWYANHGMGALTTLTKNDPGAAYIGETAFVESGSPIEKTGIIYYNTLFDENASCHLALGSGFPRVIPGYEAMSKTETANCGINISDVHEDFMIGTSDLEVVAKTNKGRVRIMSDGKFTI